MNPLEGVRIALDSLWRHKLRTLLTLLGNIVATMSVIAVVSLIHGVDNYARQKVLDEGSNVFTVSRVNVFEILTDLDAFLASLDNPDLTLADRDWLRARMTTPADVGAALETTAELWAPGGRTSRRVQVQGKTADYAVLDNWDLALGRHFTAQEVRASREVVVLGAGIAGDLFPRLADPVGREVRIGRRHFRVIGVAAERGRILGNDLDRFVVIPITAFRKVFGSGSVDIKVGVHDLTDLADAKEEVRQLMRVRHRLRPTEKDDFGIVTMDELLGIWSGISRAIYGALVPLVGISLVIGGIVLMNVMLVAVTERTREIGIRKAVGARRSAILWQFLVESIALSVTGGLLGIAIGVGLAALVAAKTPVPFAFAPWSVALGLAVTFVVGLASGTYPAWKAAGLDPVEALRHE